jgi:glyoxylase-like metal-dependent hydrolase (beta-lactamase superfamily II)
MKVDRFPAGVYQANCYIVYDEETNDGFIIDPGGDAEDILGHIKEKGINARFIILTHGHFDHTGAVNSIKYELCIPVYINEYDNDLITGQVSMFSGLSPDADNISADKFIKDGEVLEAGKLKISILDTPGHTRGGITIMIGDVVFTGDTLFLGSVGRTDLPGGSHEVLIESIKSKLLVLPDETVVYPGHGPSTSIGREKKYNPFL